MKTKLYFLPFLLMGITCYSQDKISMKNGSSLDVKLIEIGTSNITYKELDNLDGPIHSLDKSKIYKVTYNNGKTDILGKFQSIDEIKSFIINKINEYGVDRDNGMLKLAAEFEGNNIRINSVNNKGRVYYEDKYWWDISRVVEFHNISRRNNGTVFLNIVTYKSRKSKTELDKLVIKLVDYETAIALLDAFKDLNLMLKKD
ncbi:hypothetical protein DRF59_14200 [Chryseobacterium flavum]|uniref:Uncharacterized protein n=1 Tax=Chryseobacterium flavum TaxID=415851 RepID=A0A3D9CJL8_9FLAO|nr:hypothetical protein [Chryseobacterium flavum]REC65937.1 hypothetical protein DRF59_14200 [Chryseobacterium flavum]